jgi:hypothetical protein
MEILQFTQVTTHPAQLTTQMEIIVLVFLTDILMTTTLLRLLGGLTTTEMRVWLRPV